MYVKKTLSLNSRGKRTKSCGRRIIKILSSLYNLNEIKTKQNINFLDIFKKKTIIIFLLNFSLIPPFSISIFLTRSHKQCEKISIIYYL